MPLSRLWRRAYRAARGARLEKALAAGKATLGQRLWLAEWLFRRAAAVAAQLPSVSLGLDGDERDAAIAGLERSLVLLRRVIVDVDEAKKDDATQAAALAPMRSHAWSLLAGASLSLWHCATYRQLLLRDVVDACQQAMASWHGQLRLNLWLKLAQAHLLYGSRPGAARVLVQTVQRFPQHSRLSSAVLLAASTAAELRQYRDAVHYLAHAIGHPPAGCSRLSLRLRLALLLRDMGSASESADMLAVAFAEMPEAETAEHEGGWRGWSTTAATWLTAAEELLALAEAAQAALALAEEATRLARKMTLRGRLVLCEALLRTNQLERATTLLRRGMKVALMSRPLRDLVRRVLPDAARRLAASDAAILTLQAVWRGALVRRRHAYVLRARWRVKQARRQAAALLLTAWVRRVVARAAARKLQVAIRAWLRRRDAAARAIQRMSTFAMWRTHRLAAVRLLQRVWRRYARRRDFFSAVAIQAAWRGFLALRRYRTWLNPELVWVGSVFMDRATAERLERRRQREARRAAKRRAARRAKRAAKRAKLELSGKAIEAPPLGDPLWAMKRGDVLASVADVEARMEAEAEAVRAAEAEAAAREEEESAMREELRALQRDLAAAGDEAVSSHLRRLIERDADVLAVRQEVAAVQRKKQLARPRWLAALWQLLDDAPATIQQAGAAWRPVMLRLLHDLVVTVERAAREGQRRAEEARPTAYSLRRLLDTWERESEGTLVAALRAAAEVADARQLRFNEGFRAAQDELQLLQSKQALLSARPRELLRDKLADIATARQQLHSRAAAMGITLLTRGDEAEADSGDDVISRGTARGTARGKRSRLRRQRRPHTSAVYGSDISVSGRGGGSGGGSGSSRRAVTSHGVRKRRRKRQQLSTAALLSPVRTKKSLKLKRVKEKQQLQQQRQQQQQQQQQQRPVTSVGRRRLAKPMAAVASGRPATSGGARRRHAGRRRTREKDEVERLAMGSDPLDGSAAFATTPEEVDEALLDLDRKRVRLKADVLKQRHFNLLSQASMIGDVAGSLRVFERMLELRFAPQLYTFHAIIRACKHASPPQAEEAQQILVLMDRHSVKAKLATYHAVMDVCRAAKQWRRALAVLRQLQAAGLTATTITHDIIFQACQAVPYQEAPLVFDALKSAGLPTDICYSAAVKLVA